MRLEGKVAVITGAAAGVQGELMGFGGAAAWLFVKEGAKVVLSDINEETGNRTAAPNRPIFLKTCRRVYRLSSHRGITLSCNK